VSLRARYDADVRAATARALAIPPGPPICDADLRHLPPAVRAFLARAGAVGKPRVRALHALFRARLRAKPDAGWMSARVDQYDFFGPGGAERLFFMRASRAGVPFIVFHRYVGDAATMEVRLAGLIPIVDARGSEMTRSETVTLLNDMCFLAPATLVDAPITWEELGPRQVRARYTNAGQTISADLTFDGAGDLVGFVSPDRYQSDGKTYRLLPWSTPLSGHRDFGVARLPAFGEARWREEAGEWAYGQFWLERIDYDERAPASAPDAGFARVRPGAACQAGQPGWHIA
jgi:hypothetical protein